MQRIKQHLLRLLTLLLLAGLALQLFFAARIAMMNWLAPQSTSFQRSEMARLLREKHQLLWSQQWVDEAQLSRQLKRAVIASEDAGFSEHGGVDWDAMEKAWERNQQAQARAEKRAAAGTKPAAVTTKIRGGSTITQQLAKNLFLSSERQLLRKGQEFVLTLMLEALLSKERILEIYLNNVEWGEGLFGAEAAARHYFHIPARQLSANQAARLAVMLPAPKRFEKRPASPYLLSRAATIEARMPAVTLPEP